jgi:NAD(P)H-hydrate epimerase
MIRFVTAQEMRALDEETIQKKGVPGAVLMESAGRGVVEVMAGLLPLAGKKVAVVAGPGNNGGDGYVVARHLHHRGAEVVVVRAATEEQVRGDARVHHDAARNFGVCMEDGTPAGWAEAAPLVAGADVIVDALLGTGTARPVTGHFAAVIAAMNAAPGLRVAVDLPSGLDADRGHPLGVCVEAHHTVTFAFPKLGLVTHPGFLHVGALHVVDIGIPDPLAAEHGMGGWLLDEACLAPLRRPRPRDAHKGTFGHLLIVAGSGGKTGAAWLCGEAAARTGAGLVTIASPDEAQRALSGRVVEMMTEPLGPEPLDAAAAWSRLAALLEGKRAVAFGPGVGRAPAMRALLERLLATWEGPLVIDADGLNLLAEDVSVLGRRKAEVVLTPHPAEMGRLAGIPTAEVQAGRAETARRFATQHGVVVVLKGARSVIAGPGGELAINPTGNPGMASGGTGDALTGIVGALLASGLAPLAAAQTGTYLHGAAGDRAAAERGETGLLARDLIDAIPRVLAGPGGRPVVSGPGPGDGAGTLLGVPLPGTVARI